MASIWPLMGEIARIAFTQNYKPFLTPSFLRGARISPTTIRDLFNAEASRVLRRLRVPKRDTKESFLGYMMRNPPEGRSRGMARLLLNETKAKLEDAVFQHFRAIITNERAAWRDRRMAFKRLAAWVGLDPRPLLADITYHMMR